MICFQIPDSVDCAFVRLCIVQYGTIRETIENRELVHLYWRFAKLVHLGVRRVIASAIFSPWIYQDGGVGVSL